MCGKFILFNFIQNYDTDACLGVLRIHNTGSCNFYFMDTGYFDFFMDNEYYCTTLRKSTET